MQIYTFHDLLSCCLVAHRKTTRASPSEGQTHKQTVQSLNPYHGNNIASPRKRQRLTYWRRAASGYDSNVTVHHTPHSLVRFADQAYALFLMSWLWPSARLYTYSVYNSREGWLLIGCTLVRDSWNVQVCCESVMVPPTLHIHSLAPTPH